MRSGAADAAVVPHSEPRVSPPRPVIWMSFNAVHCPYMSCVCSMTAHCALSHWCTAHSHTGALRSATDRYKLRATNPSDCLVWIRCDVARGALFSHFIVATAILSFSPKVAFSPVGDRSLWFGAFELLQGDYVGDGAVYSAWQLGGSRRDSSAPPSLAAASAQPTASRPSTDGPFIWRSHMDLDVQKAQFFQELQQASVVTGASAKPLAAKFSPRFKVQGPDRAESESTLSYHAGINSIGQIVLKRMIVWTLFFSCCVFFDV